MLRTRSDVLRTWDGALARAYDGVGGMADTSGYGGRAPARARGLMERRGAAGGAGARASACASRTARAVRALR